MSQIISKGVVARVRAGIALLDERGPSGWRESINPGRLSIAFSNNCVLGQTFGDYEYGLYVLGLYGGNAAPYGFTLSYPRDAGDKRWAELTAAWRQELIK